MFYNKAVKSEKIVFFLDGRFLLSTRECCRGRYVPNHPVGIRHGILCYYCDAKATRSSHASKRLSCS